MKSLSVILPPIFRGSLGNWGFFKKKSACSATPILPHFERFLNNNNIRWERIKDADSTAILFVYQGSRFVGTIYNKGCALEICYPNILEMPTNKVDIARTICNHFNNAASNFKFTYTPDADFKNLNLHIEGSINYFDDEQFKDMLDAFFHFRHQVNHTYEQKNEETSDAEFNYFNSSRENVLLREIELRLAPDNHIHRSSQGNAMQLGHAIENVLALNNLMYKRLTITRSTGDTTTIVDPHLIHGYDLAHAILDGNGNNVSLAADYATLVLDYYSADEAKPDRITVFVADAGSDEHTHYLRINLTMLPLLATPDAPIVSLKTRSVTLLAAYDKDSDTQKQQEFDYMYAEAIRKQRNNEDLSQQEVVMIQAIKPQIAYHAYWGYRHILNKQFLQALDNLLPLYEALQPTDAKTPQSRLSNFFDTCYHIGLCYIHLQNYEKAYFYLDVLARSGNIQYFRLFLDNLLCAHDFRIFEAIENITSYVQENYPDEEDAPEYIMEFLRQLNCMNAQALVDFKRYGDAEKALHKLLKDPDCKDFAGELLARIEQEKGEKMRNKE